MAGGVRSLRFYGKPQATADGRVKLVPADIIPADERPDADYAFVLITGGAGTASAGTPRRLRASNIAAITAGDV